MDTLTDEMARSMLHSHILASTGDGMALDYYNGIRITVEASSMYESEFNVDKSQCY